MCATLPLERHSSNCRSLLRFFNAIDNLFHKKILVFRQRPRRVGEKNQQRGVGMVSNVYWTCILVSELDPRPASLVRTEWFAQNSCRKPLLLPSHHERIIGCVWPAASLRLIAESCEKIKLAAWFSGGHRNSSRMPTLVPASACTADAQQCVAPVLCGHCSGAGKEYKKRAIKNVKKTIIQGAQKNIEHARNSCNRKKNLNSDRFYHLVPDNSAQQR